jgi:4a-hydroxytetrahydrobiopterin dehydratase
MIMDRGDDASVMPDVLDDDEVEEQLPEGWSIDGDEIVRTFEFDDYMKGVNFAQLTGEIAEAQYHHPEIRIRYKEVEVRFTSHEAGGITSEDIDMAEILNRETA